MQEVPGLRLKQRVKAGEITAQAALEKLLDTDAKGKGTKTEQWLRRRIAEGKQK